MTRSLPVALLAVIVFPLAAATGGEPAKAATAEETHAQAFRFGIVSEGEVLDNLEEKKDIDVDLDLVEKQARELLLGMKRECDAVESEVSLRKEGSQEREQKVKELEEKRKELQVKAYKLNADVQQQRQKRVDELRKKIRATIAEFARKQGYSMVFEQSALLFGEEGKSLTIDIIDQMNGEYFKVKLDKKDESKDAPKEDAAKTSTGKAPAEKAPAEKAPTEKTPAKKASEK